MGYREAAALQERVVRAIREGRESDTLLLLEHPPVITLGRRADPAHVRLAATELAARGIELHASDRGGDVTYHGPGQLVGYPLLALQPAERDAHAHLRRIECGLIDALAELGVAARQLPGLTGVWIGEAKVAAIGVRLAAGWISSHGFALNVTTDLAPFETIVPCGIADRGVTSLARVAGRDPDLLAVARVVACHLALRFGRRLRAAPPLLSWNP